MEIVEDANMLLRNLVIQPTVEWRPLGIGYPEDASLFCVSFTGLIGDMFFLLSFRRLSYMDSSVYGFRLLDVRPARRPRFLQMMKLAFCIATNFRTIGFFYIEDQTNGDVRF